MSVNMQMQAVIAKAATFAGSAGWVVVVCPDRGEHIRAFEHHGAALGPAGSSFAGRTILLREGGKVSVVPASVSPFIPPDTPFDVLFFGWEDDLSSDARRMQGWREHAARVLP